MANGIKKDYYFISTLFGSITNSSELWLVDSGTSRHMIGYQSTLTNLLERDSYLHVELGDEARYAIKVVGYTSSNWI